MTAARLTSSAETGPRWRAALLVGALVLAAHAWLLGAWPRAPGPGWRAEPTRPLHVRQIRLAAMPPQPVAAPAPSPVRRDNATAASSDKAAPADARPAAPNPEPARPIGGADLPVYATLMPPPIVLSFDHRRGAAGGMATLTWAPDAGGYSLTLQAEARGQRLPGSTSRGGFDAAGLAPERHTETHRGRDMRAANFQRQAGDGGHITFSGPAVEYPLVPGAQDRLSWIVQLAAVLSANPALAQPGEQVTMFVVGTRGDGEAWVFEVAGREAVALADGERVEALKLQREPRRPYDTHVQVWLDPARHHWPVRLRLAARVDGEGREFLLRHAAPP